MEQSRRLFLRGVLAAAVGTAISSVTEPAGAASVAEVPLYGDMSSVGILYNAWNHVVIMHNRSAGQIALMLNSVSTEDIADLKVVADSDAAHVLFGNPVEDDLNLHFSQDFLHTLSIGNAEDYTIDFWFCLTTSEKMGVQKASVIINDLRITRGLVERSGSLSPRYSEYQVLCDAYNGPTGLDKRDLQLLGVCMGAPA